MNVLLLTYAVACADAFWQQWTGTDLIRHRTTNIYRDEIRRLTGPFKHCNDFATFLAPGLPIALAGFLDAKLHKQPLRAAGCLVLFAAVSACLALSLSRSSIFSAFFALLVFSLFFSFRKFVPLILIAVLAALWWIPSPLQERLHEIPSFSAGDMSERMILLKTTLRMIESNPYFGLGVNTYSDHFARFKPADYPAQMYSHNSYLQMASEIGWVGLSLYLTFVGGIFAAITKRLIGAPERTARWLAAALLAGAAGFLFNCLFESALQSTQLRVLFWSLLGCALGLTRNGFLSRDAAPYDAAAKR